MFSQKNCRQRLEVWLFYGLAVAAASLATIAFGADPVADPVFARVRAGVLADITDSRGIACMESVERTRYLARKVNRGSSCSDWIAAASNAPHGAVEWHERLRLDVTAAPEGEEFAPTGASRFEAKDTAGILRSASAGQGEFSTFLRNLFAGDGESFQSRGIQQTPLGKLLEFGFSVPAAKSHFVYSGPDGNAAATPSGYRGTIYALPDSSDLKRLTLEADDAGEACRVQYAIDYRDTRIGEHTVILPQSSVMDVVYRDGRELHSETYYSSCRRPVADPPVAMKAEPKPMPPGIRLRVRFQVPIDGETAASGDPIIGVVRTTVKDKQNGMIVHAGDRLHGRIVRIEQQLLPEPMWNVAIVFQTIERGVGDHGIDQGVEQPVSLVPLDDGDREPHDEAMGPAELQRLRPPGGAYFVFHGGSAVVDKSFETEWETR